MRLQNILKLEGNHEILKEPLDSTEHWNKLVSSGDDKPIWAAINWNDAIGETTQKSDRATDLELFNYSESVLNQPIANDLTNYYLTTPCHISISDDPIMPYEVKTCINQLKSIKA